MKQLIALAVTVVTLAATVLGAQAQTCGGTDYFNTALGQCVTRYGGQQGH
jgi:hypothetical protein